MKAKPMFSKICETFQFTGGVEETMCVGMEY